MLARSKDLQAFLEASEEDWSLEVARANHETAGGGNAAKRKLANTLQLFRELGHTTKDMIAGKTADEDEDSEYLKASRACQQMLFLGSHTATPRARLLCEVRLPRQGCNRLSNIRCPAK